MTYQLIINVDDVDFGQDAGIARAKFYGDALHIEVDARRFASREHFAAVVTNEINDFIAAKSDRSDNLTVAEMVSPDVIIEFEPLQVESVKGVPLTDPLLRSAIIPDVVIQDNRIGTQNRTSPHGDAIAKLEAEAGIAAPLQTGPLQSYSVTWRRPTAAYAHDEIEADSIENAMMQAKTMATSNRSDLFFDCDTDSMDACDWISVEGDREHTDWELPKPSAGVLMKALHDIRVLCEAMSYQPGSALLEIDAVARKAIEASVPDYSEPHTYDDERK